MLFFYIFRKQLWGGREVRVQNMILYSEKYLFFFSLVLKDVKSSSKTQRVVRAANMRNKKIIYTWLVLDMIFPGICHMRMLNVKRTYTKYETS
jgi:hypothetical protein